MRGAGKSGLSRAAGAALGVPVHDLDDDLLTEFAKGSLAALPHAAASDGPPTTVAGIIAAFGWTAFREAETELLARRIGPSATLGGSSARCIVSCGGGIVESDAARSLLLAHIAAGGSVIEVRCACRPDTR